MSGAEESGNGTFALVPVKDLHGTKSRLSPVLDPRARAGLTLYMTRRVVKALFAARIAEVCVVSPDPVVLEEVRTLGAIPLRQESSGLNNALNEGRTLALERGWGSLLVVPSDLPLVEPEDLGGLLRRGAGERGITIAPDGARTGTNALLLSPPDAVPFRFGEGSFQEHSTEAEAAGLPVAVYENEHLSFDLDTGGDLAHLRVPGARR